MTFPLYLTLPLLSAITYTLAAMLFKKVMEHGGNIWYINFLSNIGTFLIAVPFFIMGINAPGHMDYAKPLFTSVIFIAGQTFSLLSLKCGDVSVATPLLGAKVIMVAFFTVMLLGIPVPVLWWVASALAVIALALLRGNSEKSKKGFVPTMTYSLLCSICFALCDIYIQKWAPGFGADRYISVMFFIVAVLSLGFYPMFRKTRMLFPSPVSWWLIASIVFISIQGVAMAVALSRFGNATAMNIVFSSRGMWSVLFIWWFGKFLGNEERLLGRKVFWERLSGAVLILAAIVLVMVKR
ncbi:MAG TPA: DMT family transporter [Chitinivibrionales bacterium]|nr:DMT family transporter [Chitinivibrionales bacterium]